MADKPVFSVIIPTFNRLALLRRAIKSVQLQSFTRWELIVVNDGSTDETGDFVQTLNDPGVFCLNKEHGERSLARNAGIDMARSPYICFLDDDDEFEPGILQSFFDYYEKNQFPPTILRVGYTKKYPDKNISMPLYREAKHVNPVRFAAYEMCGIWSLSIPAVFLKKDRFHPEFPHWQDTHLILRLLARYGMVQLPVYGYRYYIHDHMGSKKMGGAIAVKLKENLAPIEDVFLHHGDLVTPFLPGKTKSYLIAKKYLEFAHLALLHRRFGLFSTYLKAALKTRLSVRFWKNYLVLTRDLVKSWLPS